MNSAIKIFMMIFVVAVISICCCEAQAPRINRIRSGYGSRYHGYDSGRGARNQGNQGGDTSQRSGQDGFNVNLGSGDLNSRQQNQASQAGRQKNQNGDYGW